VGRAIADAAPKSDGLLEPKHRIPLTGGVPYGPHSGEEKTQMNHAPDGGHHRSVLLYSRDASSAVGNLPWGVS
jgi:hypothetical protein